MQTLYSFLGVLNDKTGERLAGYQARQVLSKQNFRDFY